MFVYSGGKVIAEGAKRYEKRHRALFDLVSAALTTNSLRLFCSDLGLKRKAGEFWGYTISA